MKVFSPYVSYSFLDLLVDKCSRNIDVSMITTSEAVNNGFYKKLINQHRHAREDALQKRKQGRLVTLTLGLVFLLLFGASFNFEFGSFQIAEHFIRWRWAFLAASVLSFIVRNFYGKIRIYDYTYSQNLRFAVVVSPNEVKADEAYLAHAKYYIIDDEIAFLGSLNFTYSGFNKSYESCVRIQDGKVIEKLNSEFEWMFSNDRTLYEAVQTLGPKIYKEPPY